MENADRKTGGQNQSDPIDLFSERCGLCKHIREEGGMSDGLMELLSIGLRRDETASKPLLMLRVCKTIGLILILGVSMSACAGLSGHTMSWKEEVKLHDGQVIISERFYNLGGYPGLESHNRMALDQVITFSLPGTNKRIIWKNDFRDSVPEPNSLNLIRFDVVKSVPYIATYPAGCISYNKWGRPNPPQILFKYEDDQWKRITLAELPPELIGTSANVIVGRPDVRIAESFYTVEGVNRVNHDISTPEYKTILREPVKSADSVVSCPDFNSPQYRSFKAPLPMKPLSEK